MPGRAPICPADGGTGTGARRRTADLGSPHCLRPARMRNNEQIPFERTTTCKQPAVRWPWSAQG